VRHAQGANGIEIKKGARGVRIENSHLDAMLAQELGQFGSIGIVVRGSAEIHRLFFERYRVGMHLYGDNISVTENWFNGNHDGLTRWKGAGISYRGNKEGGITIERNYLKYTATRSAGINMYAEFGPIRDITVRDNYLVGNGGGFGTTGGDAAKPYRDGNRNIRYIGNRFGGHFEYPNILGDGTNGGVNMGRPGAVWKDNRWVGSSTDLPARCGITRNACG
jgi:hypothetical protein